MLVSPDFNAKLCSVCCVCPEIRKIHASSLTMVTCGKHHAPVCSLRYIHSAAFELRSAVVQSGVGYLIVLGVFKTVFPFFKLQPAFEV